jgi:hypothetical protein
LPSTVNARKTTSGTQICGSNSKTIPNESIFHNNPERGLVEWVSRLRVNLCLFVCLFLSPRLATVRSWFLDQRGSCDFLSLQFHRRTPPGLDGSNITLDLTSPKLNSLHSLFHVEHGSKVLPTQWCQRFNGDYTGACSFSLIAKFIFVSNSFFIQSFSAWLHCSFYLFLCQWQRKDILARNHKRRLYLANCRITCPSRRE